MSRLKIRSYRRVTRSADAPTVGSTLMGERGQVVIPKEFREQLGLKSGSRLMVLHHAHGPIILLPAKQMQDFIDQMTLGLTSLPKNH